MRIVSGSTNEYLHFVAFSTADHITRVTGLTGFNVYATATSASTGVVYNNLSVNEVNSTQMPGIYRVMLGDSTLLTIPSGVDSREICLHITSSMDPVTRTFELYRRTATTGQTLTVNSSGEPTNVMSKLTSIESNTTGIVTKVSSIDTKVTAIQAQTTQFVFTQAGNVDANIQYVNDVLVNGVGSTASPWGP